MIPAGPQVVLLCACLSAAGEELLICCPHRNATEYEVTERQRETEASFSTLCLATTATAATKIIALFKK